MRRRPRPRGRASGSGSPGAGDRSAVRKSGGKITIALAYPNNYQVAMSSLGFQIVYRELNRIPGVLCLRTFLPEVDRKDRASLKTYDHPREVARCDWLAFSVSYENDYLNLLAVLDSAGLPLEWKDRDRDHPLVVVGGIAPSLNPEPLADFADVMVIGEAEEALPALVAAYLKAGPKASREELLLALTKVPGVYVPRFYRARYQADGFLKRLEPLAKVPARVRRLWVKNLDAWRPDSDIASPEAEFKDMILVEVGRGCGRGCRFCAAGFFYRPVRYRSFETIRETIGRRLAEGKRIGLLGASVFDHPDLEQISRYLGQEGCSFSVSSFRADAVNEAVLHDLAAGGLRTATIAPETGTERLRGIIRKNLSDEEILGAAEKITAAGIPNIKLYFMIGLPGEMNEDVESIVELVKRVRHRIIAAARERGFLGSIIVSLSCFVPKAWTPFQWHPMEDVDRLREKQRFLTGALSKIPNVKVSHDLPRWAFIQALLSRGDRRLGQVLRLAHACGGDWKTALRQAPVNPEFYVYRPRGYRELFPWDFIDTGLVKEQLWQEYILGLGS